MLTPERVKREAFAIQVLSNDLVNLQGRINQLLRHVAALGIDWNAEQKPDYIPEDANGNLSGCEFTRQQAYAALAALLAVQRLLTNLVPQQADHLTAVNQLADALT